MDLRLIAILIVSGAAVSQYGLDLNIPLEAIMRCHQGLRDGQLRCGEYANLKVEDINIAQEARRIFLEERRKRAASYRSDKVELECDMYLDTNYHATCVACTNGSKVDECKTFPKPEELVDFPKISTTKCLNISWGTGREHTAANNFGNCMAMKTDSTHRYITSNNVPDFYVNPYCPIGLGLGYCIQQEIDAGKCFFSGLICGAKNNGPGSTDYGDVWVPQQDNYKIRLEGNPTQADRPGDMFDVTKVGAAKTNGLAQGVAINGIGIQGPNIAGDLSIDDAGFQLTCGGHVTPPLGNGETLGPAYPPKYHFHKSPECLSPFTDASKGLYAGAEPYRHAKLMGWALDGFGIYGYQEEGGVAPVVDECGGHFGPVDTGEVVYHYHSRPISPYHLACQGPALGQCDKTQSGTNYCHPGCGFQVCVQPGTSEMKLRAYLAKWDSTWLDRYTVNPYNSTM